MSDIEQIIKMAEENAMLRKALSDIGILLLSKSERPPIISTYDISGLETVFQEIYKLKEWDINGDSKPL